MSRFVKTDEEIRRIRKSAEILGGVLRALKSEARTGVSLMYLNDFAEQMIRKAGGKPAFLGYRPDGARKPFPYTLCASVGSVVVHGRPSEYKLKEGDLLKLDLGVDWMGGISDAAITVPIGGITDKEKKLLRLTKNALNEAVRAAKPGHTTGDIGYAIERILRMGGMHIIEGLTGHGVGNELHEDPPIYNYGSPGSGVALEEGMVIAIEPMAAIGTGEVRQLKDDSFQTADGSSSAHFEHTVLISSGAGAEVLTE